MAGIALISGGENIFRLDETPLNVIARKQSMYEQGAFSSHKNHKWFLAVYKIEKIHFQSGRYNGCKKERNSIEYVVLFN